jgi:hypothetical protein
MLDTLTRMEQMMKQHFSRTERGFAQVNQRLSRLESKSGEEFKREEGFDEEMKIHDSPSPQPMHGDYSPEQSMMDAPEAHERPFDREEALDAVRRLEDDEPEEQPGPPVLPGEPALPVNHTTLAGLLLTWPSIQSMVGYLLEAENIKHPSEYPIRQEQERGLLRVYGKGEGHDNRGPSEKSGTVQVADHGTLPDMADDYNDLYSSPSPGDWGQLGGLSPMSTTDVHYRSSTLTPEGNPDFSEATVRRYVSSFEEHILSMHPVITPRELDDLVKIFLRQLPHAEAKSTKPPVAKFPLVQPSVSVETGNKRKRSSPAAEMDPGTVPLKPGKPYRSIHSAVVLLVLALGKICLHRDKLPDVVPDSEREQRSHGSPLIRNGHPASPMQGSPPNYSSLPSPKEHERVLPSRRQSFQGSAGPKTGHSLRKNYDIIPGLEYFAYASDILGNQLGGATMRHAYAHIFAGLYHGQLGRVMESHVHISLACRILQIIMRP